MFNGLLDTLLDPLMDMVGFVDSIMIANASDGPRRSEVVARLAVGDALFAPAHLAAEVVAALRGMAQRRSGPRCAFEVIT